MGKDAPRAPDPVQTAQAQTQSNEQTAQFNQQLNMVGSQGPNGSVMYHADPSQPGGYTQVTSLSPGQQNLYDQSVSAQNGALGVANQQIGRVGQALSGGFDPSQFGQVQKSVGGDYAPQTQITPTSGSIAYGYGTGGNIQQDVGPQNFGSAVKDASNAAYSQATSRLDPQWQQQQRQLESQLAAQGLNSNDTAYQTALQNFNNSKTDAYNQANFSAIGAGDQEQNTLYNQQLSQGQFHNQAQLQGNTENAQAAAFNNSAQDQNFAQNAAEAQFFNQAQGQGFNQALQGAQFGNEAQQQAFQQGAYAQSNPINEFTALLGSGQVSSPSGIGYTPAQAANTNVAQIDQNSFQDQLGAYNANNPLGGLFSLGSAAITKYSDARLKEDARPVGKLDNGLTVYSYRYRGSPRRHIGVMAQEARVSHPHAVHVDRDGFLMVDYGALG